MSTQSKPPDPCQSDSEPCHFLLVASGKGGPWYVDVDETDTDPNRWFLQIEGPTVYCSFEIPSTDTVEEAHEFLSVADFSESSHAGDANKFGLLVIGKHPENPVILIRDDEYADRYFLSIGPRTALTRVTIAGKDLKDLTEALRQAVEDIEDDS